MAGPDKRPTRKSPSGRRTESMVMKTQQLNDQVHRAKEMTRSMTANRRVHESHYIAGGPDSTRKTGHRSR